MKFALTTVDLRHLRALLENMGLDKERQDALIQSVEVVSEQTVAATEHVEVDLGGEAHLQYLAKIADELIRGMGDRWIPGHELHSGLPDPGTDSSGGGAGWGGSSVDIMVELIKSANELAKSNQEGHHDSPKKQKVIHHPGQQWLDPGWHEKR